MAKPKTYTTRYRQVGEGLWEATVLDPNGEEATSILAESAVKARTRVVKDFAKKYPSHAEQLVDSGYIADDDLRDWERLRTRWKKRADELRNEQEGEEKLFYLRMMSKYGLSPDQLAPIVGVSAPTIRQRLR
jgi:hypothetical protein